MQYDEFRAMNSDILLAAEGQLDQVAAGFQQARQFIEASEKRFTRFSDDSELAQLNRAAGSWFSASAEFFEVVRQAKGLAARTGGLFDPSILTALRQAGYDRSMDELRKSGPGRANRLEKTAKQDFSMLCLDLEARAIWMPPGMQIDLGGIAKGWIAEQAALRLAKFSTACTVSAGGDMFLIGLPVGETSWQVGLEDPLDPARDQALLRARPGAMATSSVAKRQWIQDGIRQHHLIDPRTGQPVETDWLSVTVLAPHAAEAEVFAKALLIAGSNGAEDVLTHEDEIIFVAIDRNGILWGSVHSPEVIDVEFKFA